MIFCVAAGLAGSAYADKRLGGERTLQRMTSEADSVVIAECKAKKTNVVGKSFETDYELEVKEELKGKRHAAGSKLLMTVAGGRLTSPPITQMVQLQPHMFTGENVVLFLDEKPLSVSPATAKKLNPRSKLLTTPRVVGMNEGKLSVFKDGATGQYKVSRLNLENLGYVPDDEVMQRLVQAMANGELKVANGQAVTPSYGPAASSPQMPSAKNTAGFLQGKGTLPPVQDLEDFKAQVRGFAN